MHPPPSEGGVYGPAWTESSIAGRVKRLSGWRDRWYRGGGLLILALALLTCAALAVLFLHPYVVRDVRYPLGFDAPLYVIRANRATVDGLDRIGLIRSGSPLLLAALMSGSGRDALSLLAWLPALLTGVAGLAVAAMLRAAVGIERWWIPVAGVLAWTGFGRNTMVSVHLDNLLNAALVLAGFTAILGSLRWQKGTAAAVLLFVAAGLAHWPFWALAMAAYVPAAVLFVRRPVMAWIRGGAAPIDAGRLLSPVLASGATVGVSFLYAEPGSLGVTFPSEVLRRRFFLRLLEPFRYFAVPFAVAGVVTAARLSSPMPPARRFFLYLMGTWTAATVAGALLQLAGLPTAGGRLLNYYFPMPILAAVFLWWLVKWIGGRVRRPLGVVCGTALALSVLLASGGVAWLLQRDVHAWISSSSAAQVARAKTYISRLAPSAPLVFVLDGDADTPARNRSWTIVRTFLRPDQELRAQRADVSADQYAEVLAGRLGSIPEASSGSVVIALQRFNRQLFSEMRAARPDHVVSPGVAVIRGPIPQSPLPASAVPQVSQRSSDIMAACALILALLFASGGGWALLLVPPDTVMRVCLAPALGTAAVMLSALVWDFASLSLSWPSGLGPLMLAAIGGWALAGASAWRRRRARGSTRKPT